MTDMQSIQMLLAAWEMNKCRRVQKGQGVIEYAGALVVAAVLVAAVLAIGPTGINTLFTNILNSVQTYMTGQLPK